MNCEMHKLYANMPCHNEAVAQITVSGDKGSVSLDICEEHLEFLAQRFPTKESERARNQRLAAE